jgi:adenosylmethionine-8-amino-7-oxononanoate aminotransferase
MKQLFPFSVNDPLPAIKNSTEITRYGFKDNGRDILDLGLGSSGCFLLGFDRTDLIDAVTDELKKYPFCQGDFVTANNLTTLLSQKLYSLSKGYYPIYSLSGSDAIESAIKLVHMFHQGTKKKIIGFQNSYHGSTYMSSSVSGSEYITSVFGQHSDCQIIAYNQLDLIDHNTAAVIIETCSWQGGLLDLGQDYFQNLRKICDKNNALLIIDDIAFCGGKTGTLFGFEQYSVQPDIFCIGKGITGGYFPLSATLCNQRVADVIKPQMLMHGFSYSFPMAGIISVLKYLDILEKENILSNHNSIISTAQILFDDLKNQKLIKDYRNFGVCFNLVLNMEISNYLEKESLFYKNGMHMGIWNSNRNGVLVMIPITAKTDYFDSLKNKLISVLNETNSNR